MRHYLKAIIIATIAFYVATSLIPTIDTGSFQNILIIITGIFLAQVLIHPIFSLVLIPINLLTFGLVTLALNVVLILGFIEFLPGFAIAPYSFPGADIQGLIIPAIDLNFLGTVLATAAAITIVQKILNLIFN